MWRALRRNSASWTISRPRQKVFAGLTDGFHQARLIRSIIAHCDFDACVDQLRNKVHFDPKAPFKRRCIEVIRN
jgi:hypothetical protein